MFKRNALTNFSRLITRHHKHPHFTPRPWIAGTAARSFFTFPSSLNPFTPKKGQIPESIQKAADANPSDELMQLELFKALLAAEKYDLIIERYKSGRYALDEDCTRIYMTALDARNIFDSVMPAIHKTLCDPLASRTTTKLQIQGLDRVINFATLALILYLSATFAGQYLESNRDYKQIFLSFEDDRNNEVKKGSASAGGAAAGSAANGVPVSPNKKESNSNPQLSFKQPANGVGKIETQLEVKFEDVQGCDEAKDELIELVEFLKNPERFQKHGAKLPRGVLLEGPPGTGKTLLAKALAGEAGVPFISASGSDFDEMFVGVGAKRVRELFKVARENSPCIVFIDEIDAILGKRTMDQQNHSRQTLNQFLNEVDGFEMLDNVVIVGATNLAKLLDPAALRPGRFDKRVHVSPPDVKGRTAILKLHLKNARLSKNVDLELLARSTPGFTGADLANLANQAKIIASLANHDKITMKHLEKAKDDCEMGRERKSMHVSPLSRKITAYHESGHAVVAIFTPGSNPVEKATIVPRGHALGYVSQISEDESFITKRQLLAQMDVAMGGRVAEELIFGEDNVTGGASSDFEQATRLAYTMVKHFGMSEKIGHLGLSALEDRSSRVVISESLQKEIDGEAKRLLEESKARATATILKHRESLEKLATALLDREALNKDEIETLLNLKKDDQVPTVESNVLA